MIFTVASLKGGVGKTTIAINLACYFADFGDTLLVDAEGTAISFSELRFNSRIVSKYETKLLKGKSIYSCKDEFKSKFNNTVIDIGGEDVTGSLRASVLIADVVILPVKPRNFDVWRAEETYELIQEARNIRGNSDPFRCIAVINEADTQGKDNAATIDYLKSLDNLDISPILLSRRKAFSNSLSQGLAISEYNHDPKAKTEMDLFIKYILNS